MATKLVLESRSFFPPWRHNQNLFALHKLPNSFLQNSTTFPRKNPTTSFKYNPFAFKHEIITVSNFSASSETNANTKQEKKTLNNQINLILDAISKFIKMNGYKAIPTVVLACVLMVLQGHGYVAWGASGGVMGGSSFSSRSSSGRSSSGSSSRSSSSSSSRSSSRSSSSSSSTYPSYSSSKVMTEEEEEEEEFRKIGLFIMWLTIIVCFLLIVTDYVINERELTARETNSIVKIQVGLLGTAKSLQSDLNKIALTADTSTPKGISYVLTQTILALLRHPDYFISAYSSVNTKSRHLAGEKLFRQISVEERAKFDEETLVNLDNTKKQTKISKNPTGFHNEFIVVTILAAVKGVLKLPTIKGSVDLKDALQKLGSIPYHETIAAEILWTPQAENDTFSEQELYRDYPLLKTLVDDMHAEDSQMKE